MEITKTWLETQKKGLQSELQQLERDMMAKDGAIQAIDNMIAYLDQPEKKEEVDNNGSN